MDYFLCNARMLNGMTNNFVNFFRESDSSITWFVTGVFRRFHGRPNLSHELLTWFSWKTTWQIEGIIRSYFRRTVHSDQECTHCCFPEYLYVVPICHSPQHQIAADRCWFNTWICNNANSFFNHECRSSIYGCRWILNSQCFSWNR